MKNILSSLICTFMLLCSGLSATPMHQGYSSDICIGCEDDCTDIYVYMHYKMKEINRWLTNYELDGDTHQVNFDYHVGYLNGQYAAYKNLEDRFKPPAQH